MLVSPVRMGCSGIPETNSSPLKMGPPLKRRFLLETIIFGVYVSFRECINGGWSELLTSPGRPSPKHFAKRWRSESLYLEDHPRTRIRGDRITPISAIWKGSYNPTFRGLTNITMVINHVSVDPSWEPILQLDFLRDLLMGILSPPSESER